MDDRSFQQKIRLRAAASLEEQDVTLTCTLRQEAAAPCCEIALAGDGLDLAGSGPDFFEAFCGVREQLARHGWVPLCYGASRNVFPSRKSRDKSAGLKAYRLEMGRTGRNEDLVHIFDGGGDLEPASVAVQRAFFDAWLETLKPRPTGSDEAEPEAPGAAAEPRRGNRA